MYTLFFMDYPELILLANSSLWTLSACCASHNFCVVAGWRLGRPTSTTQKKK